VRRLAASFADLTVGAQQPVVRRDARQIAAFVQRDVEHLRRREVDEPFGTQQVEEW
jgi:hypothetical protein